MFTMLSFQSYNSSIQTKTKMKNGRPATNFQSYNSSIQTNVGALPEGITVTFQSYNSSIQTLVIGLLYLGYEDFQSYNSSIQTSNSSKSIPFLVTFNPIIVRFKLVMTAIDYLTRGLSIL